LVAFQPPAEQPPAEQPPSETPAPAEAPPAVADPAAAPADAPQPPAAPAQETEEEMKERLELIREEITKANQRKIDERNDRLEKAQKRVKELNARFADWYYVISEDVYKKLRVTQAELVTKPQAGSPQPGGLPSGLPGNFNLPFGPGGN
jgi:TolA-binding protein